MDLQHKGYQLWLCGAALLLGCENRFCSAATFPCGGKKLYPSLCSQCFQSGEVILGTLNIQ